MGERNVMFLDLPSHLLVAACVAAFLLGARWIGERTLPSLAKTSTCLRPSLVALPLLAFVVLNLVSILLLLKNNPSLLVTWLTDAHSVKVSLDTTGGLSNALPALYACCWWALWRLMEYEHATDTKAWFLRILVALSIFLAAFTALIKVARYDLLPTVVGCVFVVLIHKFKRGQITLWGNIYAGARLAVFAIAIFLTMAWLRGSEQVSALAQNALGYSAASFNRLAALVDGQINFPYAGTGIYAFRFLSYIPFLDRWISLGGMLGLPRKEDAWLSEFVAVSEAGLDGSYIWVSAFGYVYSDLGFLAIVYFFAMGLMAQWTWNSMLKGNTFGLVAYPYVAFSILFWMGDNFIAYSKVFVFMFLIGVLSTFEFASRLMVKGKA